MKIRDAVIALAALAQETRLAVYRALVNAGPEGLAAGRIAESLSVPAATLSFHLKELGNAGLVTWRQDGRYVIYTANFDSMNALLAYLTAHCCQGKVDDCLTVAELATSGCRPSPAKQGVSGAQRSVAKPAMTRRKKSTTR